MARQLSTTPFTNEQPRAMTYEDFRLWAGEEMRAEWVDGEVILLEMPTPLHQQIILFLGGLMSQYSRLLDLGVVLIAPFEMRLAPVRSSRDPDIAFVARDHLDRITARRLEGPADLVVEVISSDSVRRDRRDKFHEYAKAGVLEYWMTDARARQRYIHASRLTGDGVYERMQPDADGRMHSVALSGFWLDPVWLDQHPLPDPDELLMEFAADRYFEKISALYEARRRSSKR